MSFFPCVRSFADVDDYLLANCPTDLVPSSEYRSAIFTNSDEQLEIAKRVTAEIQAKHFDPQGTKIVTQIVPAGRWWDAEEYHQEYLEKVRFSLLF